MASSVLASMADVASSSTSTFGLAKRGPGQGDALALAARECEPALADHGVVAVGELLDEAVGVGERRGPPHLRVGGVGASEGDVVADRGGEEEALLEHDADGAAHRVDLERTDVVAVEAHGAAVDVVEAGEQQGERRLARARAADDGDALTGGDAERHVVEHRPALAVGEGHPVDVERAPWLRDGPGVRCVATAGCTGEQLEHAVGAGPQPAGSWR